MRSQYNTDEEWYYNPNRYFISIAGIADGCEYPCPFLAKNSEHVCRLLFDDVTEIEKDNPCIRIFDEDHANKIFEFVKNVPNHETVSIYVNCAAGISRSGAVGYVLNLYFNKFIEDNEHDYNLFNQNNSQIQPNPYVKNLLMSKFGLGY